MLKWISLGAIAACLCALHPADGQDAPAGERPPLVLVAPIVSELGSGAGDDPRRQMPAAEANRLTDLLEYLIRENIPATYEDKDDWGKTKRIYAGVKLRRDGWRLETKRRWRELNHGAWRRVAVQRIDPDESLLVRLKTLEPTAPGRWQYELYVETPVQLLSQWMQWSLDVRLWQLTAVVDARVQLRIAGTISVYLDPVRIPPDFVVAPVVEEADFQISYFQLQRVGKIRGDVAEELGEFAYEVLDDAVIKPARRDMVARLNRQIDRKSDALRLSPSAWIEKYLSENHEPAQPTEKP